MKNGFMKGMIAGTVMGIGAVMMINPIDQRDKKRMTQTTNRVFTTLGSFADNFMDMHK